MAQEFFVDTLYVLCSSYLSFIFGDLRRGITVVFLMPRSPQDLST